MAACGSVEELKQKHRNEKKELQGQIQQLKHAVPKGDKKRKKSAAEEIAKLEVDLQKKQQEELENEAKGQDLQSDVDVSEKLTELAIDEPAAVVLPQPVESGGQKDEEPKNKKISKAQRRRDKKVEKERERDERIKEEEKNAIFSPRFVEAKLIKDKLLKRRLCVYEIPSDGNCLYNAISHQLGLSNIQASNERLRERAADYMLKHPDDFLPFLCHTDTEEPYTQAEYEEYCSQVSDTSAWGGNIEIRALSHVLRLPVEVLQGDGPDIIIGEEYHSPTTVTITYHRFALGLGEHYNAVLPRSNDDGEEDGIS